MILKSASLIGARRIAGTTRHPRVVPQRPATKRVRRDRPLKHAMSHLPSSSFGSFVNIPYARHMGARRVDAGSGNGDRCPVTPGHGAMFVLSHGDRQYCSHHSHDGAPKTSPLGPADRAPSLWPTGHLSFAAAAASYHGVTAKAAAEPSALPELDVTLEA